MGFSRMGTNKRTAVMYGAGNIGRGFIGQVFSDSGFEVVFVDVDHDVISGLNERNSYTQLIIDGDQVSRHEVTGVRAVDGYDKDVVSSVIADCDILAVSVGAAVLPHIAPLLADGLSIRTQPLNILVCENLIHAPAVLKEFVSKHLSDKSKLERIGFVGATIGRMVPVVPPQQRKNDPTSIAVEPFCTLPIDGDAVVYPMPELKYTNLCSPFAFEEGKKLYIHNMGHSLAAYYGFLQGYEFVWQSMENEVIYGQVHGAMKATAEALARKYNEDRALLLGYVEDLLHRFGNKGLGDSVARVGGDPMRKLAPGDRLIGAVDLCNEQGVECTPILHGIAAAMQFNMPGDPSASLLRERVSEIGVITFLKDYCGISDADTLKSIVDNTYL